MKPETHSINEELSIIDQLMWLLKDLFKKLSTNLTLVDYLFIFGWLLLSFYITLYHEPWRDETQAWLMARDLSWINLLFGVPNEGHPRLWHSLLKAMISLGMPFQMMNIVHMFISFITVVLLYKYGPWPRYIKILIVLGYFFIFEYNIVARNYVFINLLLVLYAIYWNSRLQNPFRTALVFSLMCQTHVFGNLIVVILGSSYIYDILKAKVNKTKYLLPGFLVVLSSFYALWLCFPKGDFSVGFNYQHLNFILLLKMILNNLITVSNAPSGLQENNYFLFLLFLSLIIYALPKFRFFLETILLYLLIILFSSICYGGGIWHMGVPYVFLIFQWWCCLISKDNSPTGALSKKYFLICNMKNVKSICKIGTIAFLLSSVLLSGFMVKQELNYKFSGSKSAGIFLNKYLEIHDNNQEIMVISQHPPEDSSILPYLNRVHKLYAPGFGYFSFISWNGKLKEFSLLTEKEHSYKIQQVIQNHKGSLYLLSLATEPKFLTDQHWRKIYEDKSETLRGGESFVIFRYQKSL